MNIFQHLDLTKLSGNSRKALQEDFQFTSVQSVAPELHRHLDTIITTQTIIERYNIDSLNINALGFSQLNLELINLYRACKSFPGLIGDSAITTWSQERYFHFLAIKRALEYSKVPRYYDVKLKKVNYRIIAKFTKKVNHNPRNFTSYQSNVLVFLLTDDLKDKQYQYYSQDMLLMLNKILTLVV